MTSMTVAREVVAKHFENVQSVDDLVLRGEKRHGNKCYAIAYVDFADDIVERANHLREFQERVLGEDFFQSPEQLRWNNYLYLVAGPNSISSDGYLDAKLRIEADKDYARKRVVSEAELVELLEDSKLFEIDKVAATADVVGGWAKKLTEGRLDTLLDQPTPRTTVLENIASGTAARQVKPRRVKSLDSLDAHFGKAHLRELEVSAFRPVHDGRSYSFGAVTLIVGPNGTGKTSLLEAIEYLYCGHNRRSVGTPGMLVNGTFRDEETGEAALVSSTSDGARITARCLAWYGRAERQGKAIVDAFTKYNFLDTDAAFRLSTELKPGDIAEDLSRLLIGAEAATLWDYLTKIRSALEIEWGKSAQQIEREADRATYLEQEISQLKSAPSTARSLSTTFRSALLRLGWKGLNKNPEEIVSSSERTVLELLAGELNFLATSNVTSFDTLAKLRSRRISLNKIIEEQGPAEQRRLELGEILISIDQQIEKTNNAIDCLNEWLGFCVANFPAVVAELNTSRANAENLRKQLGRFISKTAPVVDQQYSFMSLPAAEVSISAVANASSALVVELEATARDVNTIEARFAQASQQLREAALTLIAIGSDKICPACGTSHEAQVLQTKIMQTSSRMSVPEPLNALQSHLHSAQVSLADARRNEKSIQEVKAIGAQLEIHDFATVVDVIAQFESIKQDCASADEALNVAQERFASLELRGLTNSAFNMLRSKVTPLLGDSDLDDADFVRDVRDRQERGIIELETQRSLAQSELANLLDSMQSAIHDSVGSFAFMDIGGPPDLSSVEYVLEQTEEAIRVAERVATKIDFAENDKFSEIQSSVRTVLEAFDQALHAANTESSSAGVAVDKEHELQACLKTLSALRSAAKNQRLALNVLESMQEENSLESATRTALDSIRDQINDVFGRIHSPNEYEYDGNGATILRTRTGHISRTLNEVSTGQRAAFALSIFLALNLTARSAPPVILIDDPIAHIDDLNALSFIDYLRDLAVHSGRQIFFATADSRVAALFEKKFAFLGNDRFKKVELARRVSA